MRSNYKQLGQYISEINVKNTNLEVDLLLGVSITKKFIPSIANTIGTDMSKYKVVRKNQFGYGPITSRNGDKISVALLTEEQCIISTSYRVFEIKDHEELDPEYLMMWFRRPEFDRYARFMSHGSTREAFDWDEMCETELPVPSIEKQREIVKEYNTIVNRIKLNEQLNQKLEETAQALYKHWFEDFEFPNENGQPYKSSGGEMVYNEELDQEIPVGWGSTVLGSLLQDKGYIRGPFGSALKKDDMVPSGIPVYEQQHAIDNHRNFRYYINEEKHISLARFTVRTDDMVISCSGTLGRVARIKEDDPKGVINQALLILRPDPSKIKPVCFYQFLISKNGNSSLIENSSGSAQVNIAKREIIQSIPFALSTPEVQNIADSKFEILYKRKLLLEQENECLKLFKDMVLSKMSKVESLKTEQVI